MKIFLPKNFIFINGTFPIVVDTREKETVRNRKIFNTTLIETFKDIDYKTLKLLISHRELRIRIKECKLNSGTEGNCYLTISNLTNKDLYYILYADKIRKDNERKIKRKLLLLEIKEKIKEIFK